MAAAEQSQPLEGNGTRNGYPLNDDKDNINAPMKLGLEASARVPLWRPAYVIEPAGEVHQAAPVVGRAALRLRLEFP